MAGAPLSLPVSYASDGERDRKVAATVNQLIRALARSGPTADRPSYPTRGMMYFDTDLNSPIWWNGTNWIWPSSEVAPS